MQENNYGPEKLRIRTLSTHFPTEELLFYKLCTYYPVKIKVGMPAKHVQSQQYRKQNNIIDKKLTTSA